MIIAIIFRHCFHYYYYDCWFHYFSSLAHYATYHLILFSPCQPIVFAITLTLYFRYCHFRYYFSLLPFSPRWCLRHAITIFINISCHFFWLLFLLIITLRLLISWWWYVIMTLFILMIFITLLRHYIIIFRHYIINIFILLLRYRSLHFDITPFTVLLAAGCFSLCYDMIADMTLQPFSIFFHCYYFEIMPYFRIISLRLLSIRHAIFHIQATAIAFTPWLRHY